MRAMAVQRWSGGGGICAGTPGVDDFEAAEIEVGGVPCGERGAARAGDGGDLGVGVGDRPAGGAASGGDVGEGDRGGAVEGQDAAGKIDFQ